MAEREEYTDIHPSGPSTCISIIVDNVEQVKHSTCIPFCARQISSCISVDYVE